MEGSSCQKCGKYLPNPQARWCTAHAKEGKALEKTQRNQAKVASEQPTEEEPEKGKPDRWFALHGGTTCQSEVKITTLDGAYATASHGLPTLVVLTEMVAKAQGLKISKAQGKHGESLGIHFHIVNYTAPVLSGPSNCSELYDRHIKNKPGSAGCFENTFLPLAVTGGHLLVHQNLAPCLLCCEGYRKWAMAIGATIVVAFDKGYDGSDYNGVFIFSSTGTRFVL